MLSLAGACSLVFVGLGPQRTGRESKRDRKRTAAVRRADATVTAMGESPEIELVR
jgi:hypothetical protein